MIKLKWFETIEAEQAETRKSKPGPLPPFNLDVLGPDTPGHRRLVWFINRFLLLVFFILRVLCPNPRIGRLVVVTRAADVRAVLEDPATYEVPFGPEMTELAGGTNGVLGLDGEAHARQNKIIREVVLNSDLDLISTLSGRFARALIDGSGGRIDVVGDLITRVASETCARYFGMSLTDPDAFAEWAMSVSALLFADPTGNRDLRAMALNGAARIRAVINQAIQRSKTDPQRGGETLVDRLVTMQAQRGEPSDGEILAILMALMTGLVPTITLAAGRILEELLRRPSVMRDAVKAARAGDRAALSAILFEAERLNSALQPGQWRYARQDGVIAAGTWRARAVPQGSVLMVATMSALRDGRIFKSPNRFQADRDQQPDLMFGDASHYCLGKHVAMTQMTEVFLALLALPGLRRCQGSDGGLAWVGPFPHRLDMEFQPTGAPAEQNMITICAPVREGITKLALESQIESLGNPAQAAIRATLDATGIVHFASLAVVESSAAENAPLNILLELSVDGPVEPALRLIAEKADAWLGPVFAHAANSRNLGLADLLIARSLNLQTSPWGATGLCFFGTREFPVADIERQASLSAFAKDALDHYLKRRMGLGGRAVQELQFVRRVVDQDPRLTVRVSALRTAGRAQEADELAALMRRGAEFADFLIRPSRRRLLFTQWTDPGPWTIWGQLTDAAATAAGRRILIAVAALVVVLTALIFAGFGPLGPTAAGAGMFREAVGVFGRVLVALACSLLAAVAAVAAVAAGFLVVLQRHEASDVPDDREPDVAHVEAIARLENHPGYAQNHIIAVTPMKPGWFRKFTLALALWGITLMVKNRFRPGFVVTMGTIHYARWFRLPGTDQLVFFSNYDGSWQSYLEDFIMRAHQGQTAVWSNGIGFPRTRFLIEGGAQDGERFKRWVRRQQRASLFWYSRFPQLTTEQIRNNALIHDGLVRAENDTAARAWLGCFGSLQRPEYFLEADEVQSLVFSGLGQLPHAAYALVRAPASAEARRNWLSRIMQEPSAADGLDPDWCVSFGDHAIDGVGQKTAAFVAFSASGLAKFGVPNAEEVDGLGTFPNVFNIGMANRSRVLGDSGKSAPAQWYWSDASRPGRTPPAEGADVALIIYARTPELCRASLAAHAQLLGGAEAFVHVVETRPVAGRNIDYEHFGFRDGISQPVIRGTQRFAKGATLPRDIVEPGEFVMGYQNNQGYFPPPITVRAESDSEDNLPIAVADNLPSFPDFWADDPAYAPRDLGRNGSFLVIRQLVQDVKGFAAFTEAKAAEIANGYQGVRNVTGAEATADWVAAKMLGRWRDGTPLIDRPTTSAPGTPAQSTPDNDFSYGVDDPSGLLCPLGAHIRRANPRDSLQPGDPTEQLITNRHRLLRRGRTYESAASEGESEKGLLFVCLCGDVERQFEFVQQTWVGSPGFHGLSDEPDPVITQSDSEGRVFTIPTTAGPVTLHDMQSFVTVRGGGYFFLPSRSAIEYLIALN
ncbi:MAG TPA: cytochrome P450 [Caulobacteraceae bacterium]